MAKRCFYEVLEVVRTSSDKEIATSYRKLAIQFHPDANPGDEQAAEKFKEAAEAYEVLSDGEKRGRYDQYGHAGLKGQATEFHSANDILDAFGDLFSGSVFDAFFGGGRSRRQPRRGADVRCDVEMTLEEAALGVNKSVSFQRRSGCDDCQGTGAEAGSKREQCGHCGGRGHLVQSAGILRVQTACPRCNGEGSTISRPCRSCGGTGFNLGNVTLDVAIPGGVDTGIRVRIPGAGEPSFSGGPHGDCYCFVHVKDHPIFHRDGRQLIVEVPITYGQAVLGASIEVPALNGVQTLKIPPGTQSGKLFILRKLGMPDPHGGPIGDLLVKTYIEVPKNVGEEYGELLQRIAELEQANVTPHRKSFLKKIKEYLS